MPELTRRRYPQAREECWHIYYGDVHVGTIRIGVPHDQGSWGWICGLYPGSAPGEQTNGIATTFDQARAGFEEAWRVFLSKRAKAGFLAWRDRRDWAENKYAMRERGQLMPSQKPNTMMRCPCGATFNTRDHAGSYLHRRHIYAAQAATGIRRE
jgi:hypothetical protein